MGWGDAGFEPGTAGPQLGALRGYGFEILIGLELELNFVHTVSRF
jgi:hypothetical protein